MGFYRFGQIEPLVPQIRTRVDNVVMGEEVDERVAPLVERLLADNARPEGQSYQIFILSPPDDKRPCGLRNR